MMVPTMQKCKRFLTTVPRPKISGEYERIILARTAIEYKPSEPLIDFPLLRTRNLNLRILDNH